MYDYIDHVRAYSVQNTLCKLSLKRHKPWSRFRFRSVRYLEKRASVNYNTALDVTGAGIGFGDHQVFFCQTTVSIGKCDKKGGIRQAGLNSSFSFFLGCDLCRFRLRRAAICANLWHLRIPSLLVPEAFT